MDDGQNDPLFMNYILSGALPMSLPDVDESVIPPDDLVMDEPGVIVRAAAPAPTAWEFLTYLTIDASWAFWLIVGAFVGLGLRIASIVGYLVKWAALKAWGLARRVVMSRKGIGY